MRKYRLEAHSIDVRIPHIITSWRSPRIPGRTGIKIEETLAHTFFLNIRVNSIEESTLTSEQIRISGFDPAAENLLD